MERYLTLVAGLLIVAVVIACVRIGRARPPAVKIRNWLCYYAIEDRSQDFQRFDLIVFDGTYHPVLPGQPGGRPLLLGYASVGEVVEQGHLWERVRDRPFLREKNRFWGSWTVDVTDPGWQSVLLDGVIPAIAERGFNGFFLDNFDSALGYPECTQGECFDRRKAALITMVRRIRTRYPECRIAVNRGLPILADLVDLIDFVVIEGLCSTYDFSDHTYRPTDAYTQNLLLQQLQQGLRLKPNLQVLTVDYAAPEQTDLIAEAIAFSRSRGFVPYVGTYRLDRIFFHALGTARSSVK